MTIKLYNTKVRKKVDFTPIDAEKVRMYVCGPTVYDRAHLGNARPVIVFDTLFRLLRHTYGADHVTYVRNFTDVDDKINATALSRQEAGAAGTLEELISQRSDETIGWYLSDMAAVGAMEPSAMPRATGYIAEMIAMIKVLISKGYAYSKPITFGHNSREVRFKSDKAPQHSFFKVDEDERYGELSGRSLEDMIAGSRAEVGEGKDNPMDFVLWKPSNSEEPGWESPWGLGRPGWHIECSAMAKALLGDTFDIHGGGLDLQFPHHENEIAQSCCANDTSFMANIWMHNEMLQVEGKKMSKSLGNFFTVRDLLDRGVAGDVIRFVMLSTHYRKPMDWTAEKASIASGHLHAWYGVLETYSTSEQDPKLIEILSNDLNTPEAMTHLHGLYKAGAFAKLRWSLELLGFEMPENAAWWEVWSVQDKAAHPDQPKLTQIEDWIRAARNTAMLSKDFAPVDWLKSQARDAGVDVRMSKDSVEVVPNASFDNQRLYEITPRMPS